jgi:hemolysin activation/secretion protein
MNGTLQLRAEGNRNRITLPPFDVLNIRGESELYEISYRQPIVRSPREELALSFGFTAQGGQTFVADQLFGFGPDPSGITRTRVIKFGQDYVRRDPQGAWALRSQFSFGTGWFDATQNPDPIPDGQFFSWLGQMQRVQRLGDDHLFIAQADLQLTPDGLLPSQQFVMGGGQSVRGYRQNARFGDNGFRISLEDRITVHRDPSGATILQLAPFVDAGAVWNVGDNPTRLPSQTFLAGAGLGILWAPLPQLNVRLDYGVPLVDLSDRGNNAQDRGFYFSVNYQL